MGKAKKKFDEVKKKHSRTSPDVQFKELSLTKQKTRPRTDYEWIAFSLHFLFRRDQNHYTNLTSEIIKMCELILKKRQRPNTIQILWIVKK